MSEPTVVYSLGIPFFVKRETRLSLKVGGRLTLWIHIIKTGSDEFLKEKKGL